MSGKSKRVRIPRIHHTDKPFKPEETQRLRARVESSGPHTALSPVVQAIESMGEAMDEIQDIALKAESDLEFKASKEQLVKANTLITRLEEKCKQQDRLLWFLVAGVMGVGLKAFMGGHP